MTVGFLATTYTTGEFATVILRVGVIRGELGRNISVFFATSDGTAVSLLDYGSLELDLIFTPNLLEYNLSVDIIADDLLEGPENFFGSLETTDSDVIVSPGLATIEITDDDCECQ